MTDRRTARGFTPLTEIVSRMREEIARTRSADSVAADVMLRASIVMERVSPLDWLRGAPDALRFYGSVRDRHPTLEVGGIGQADVAEWAEAVQAEEVFERLRRVLDRSADGLRYYGGFRFASAVRPDTDWAPFGVCRFIIPRFELRTAPEASQLSFHFRASEANGDGLERYMEQLAAMIFVKGEWEDTIPPPRSRVDRPGYEGWKGNVTRALEEFRKGTLQKIVLARKVTFEFSQSLDPITLLHRLKSATPDCFHFCYMPSPDLAFVGASPERLYRRESNRIETEAVAGTRVRVADEEEDQRIGLDLLHSEKDQREHAFVCEAIRSGLAPFCTAFDMAERPSLLKLARGQHLYTPAQGRLRPNVSDATLLTALHPTPALGGTPTEHAMTRIAEWEPFDRGWYAAPAGWVSRDGAEFAVAIRSGLVEPHRLSLFSGAGLVEGSTPEDEWDEIEHKIGDFIKVITGA